MTPDLRPSPPALLTIAGHDPSSGAGITADLQTFAAHGLFGTSAITALTVQSTQGIAEIQPISPLLLRQTLDHLQADMPAQGIKIGMLGSAEAAETIAAFLKLLPTSIPIVFDPVLRSSSGTSLLPAGSIETLHKTLLPLVTWLTPNWSELSALTAQPIHNLATAESALHHLGLRHPHLHLVATAGDHTTPTDLLRLPTGEIHYFPGKHIESTSTHGTGCAFSSALLCNRVKGIDPTESVHAAKHFVAQAILSAPIIGHGRGPLNLLWPLQQLHFPDPLLSTHYPLTHLR